MTRHGPGWADVASIEAGSNCRKVCIPWKSPAALFATISTPLFDTVRSYPSSPRVALVADAAHNLSDVLGLGLAWGAALLAARKPTARRTYGLRKSTVLAALANAVLLLVTVGGVAWEALGRFRAPEPVESHTVMIVAAIGVAINGVAALLFVKGSAHDINIKGALLHLLADAAVSLGVVAVGFLVLRTGYNWLDPAASLVISLAILVTTWGLLKESLDLVLDAVPERIQSDDVLSYLTGLPGVLSIHDLHIWGLSTREVALTAHLIMPDKKLSDSDFRTINSYLHDHFKINHVTLQVEAGSEEDPCHRVESC